MVAGRRGKWLLVGSVLMLVAILMLYFSSDVGLLADNEIENNTQNTQIKWSGTHLSEDARERIGAATVWSAYEENKRSQLWIFSKPHDHDEHGHDHEGHDH